jgi:hypothetical protein
MIGKRCMLDDEHHIGPMASELLGLAANPRTTEEQRVNLSALRVGQPARGGDGLERDLSQRATARLGECKHVGHQSTFASV